MNLGDIVTPKDPYQFRYGQHGTVIGCLPGLVRVQWSDGKFYLMYTNEVDVVPIPELVAV